MEALIAVFLQGLSVIGNFYSSRLIPEKPQQLHSVFALVREAEELKNISCFFLFTCGGSHPRQWMIHIVARLLFLSLTLSPTFKSTQHTSTSAGTSDLNRLHFLNCDRKTSSSRTFAVSPVPRERANE